MPVHIAENRQATEGEWEEHAKACGYATFFHTAQWVRFFEETYGRRRFRAQPRMIVFSDGARAVVPFARWLRGFGLIKTDFCCLAGTYGGWISAQTLTQEHARLLATMIAARHNLIWRENPYDPLVGSYPMPGAMQDSTHVIDLRSGGSDILKRSDYAHRKAVKRALSARIMVRCAESSDDWLSHFRAYQISQLRWKRRGLCIADCHPWRLFEVMQKSCPQNVKLWIAQRDGIYLAGVIALYWNHHAVSWHGAAIDEYLHLRPNNLLYEEMIADAARRGFWWFDCNPSAGLEGVEKFKEHLGARRLPCRMLLRSSGIRRVGVVLKKIGKKMNRRW